MKHHNTANYLLNPTHRVTVNLIGCGGTGTQVLSGLARLNQALIAIGHPGLLVTVYDADVVTEANVGRQLFSPSDIGMNKSVISVSRINRFFGLDWAANTEMYFGQKIANITISCVDTAKARIEISNYLKPIFKGEPYGWPFYWMDYGNSKTTGQVILGSIGDKTKEPLKNVVQLLPNLKKVKEKDLGPSCSLTQALNKQDLFINSTLANLGLALLWKLFREGRIRHQGCYLNLDTMIVNPIKIEG
jgi:PRTRC genetic system ThiF family protein